MDLTASKTVSEYIAAHAPAVRSRLRLIRSIVKKEAPQAEEKMSYGMPSYRLNGPLLYFGGYAKHIGLYVLPAAVGALKKELAAYKTSKSSVSFPHDKPLPLALIRKIVRYRVKEAKAKKK